MLHVDFEKGDYVENFIFKGFLIGVVSILGIAGFISGGMCETYAGTWGNKSWVSFHENSNTKKDVHREEDDDDEDAEADDDESHNAGKNCLSSGCHSGNGEEPFSVGGTIYTNADGTDARAGATIKVVDANGGKVTLTSDGLGNFYTEKDMEAPFTITASYKGRKVKMPGNASTGGCNADGCHASGSSTGRVFISTNDLDLTGAVYESGTGGSSEISYNSDVKSILDTKCISCHQSGGVQSDTPLTTYADITDSKLVTPGSEDSLLIRKLNKDLSEGTMWKNLNSTGEYNTIKNWIVVYNAQESSSSQNVAGTAISGAKVKLSQNGRIKYRTVTDATGDFTLQKVKAGKYTLKISKKGYTPYTQAYRMNQGNIVSLEVALNKK